MLICAISDTHGRHHQLDMSQYPADILIHAGDWTRGRDVDLSETRDFLHWLSKQPYNHKICIAGNHERQVEATPDFHSLVAAEFPDIIYLQDSGVTIDGINIYGSPYSNEFCNWAFMEDELDLAPIWSAIPDDTHILITHGPAYGVNDEVNQDIIDPHVGSTNLLERINQLPDLKLHISGHIHEAYSSGHPGRYTSICPSILNERYELVNEPILCIVKD